MLNYLKEHSYDIFKMMMYQFMMAMIGLVMSGATSSNDTLFLITSIIYTVVYFVILYLMTYELGHKDRPAIVGGRAEFKPLKGFWMALTANIGNIVCAIMIVVFSFFLVYQQPVSVLNEAGEVIPVYTEDGKELSLYSDSGNDAVILSDSSHKYPSEVHIKDMSKPGATDKVTVYDKDSNALDIYTHDGKPLSNVCTSVKNWASNLYGIPLLLATFFQIFYSGIHYVVFDHSIYFFLVTPILPIFFASLGYYLGATEKRIFFFLPERRRKPPKHR